jgi:hypothetical protein
MALRLPNQFLPRPCPLFMQIPCRCCCPSEARFRFLKTRSRRSGYRGHLPCLSSHYDDRGGLRAMLDPRLPGLGERIQPPVA